MANMGVSRNAATLPVGQSGMRDITQGHSETNPETVVTDSYNVMSCLIKQSH
jgi:hypothetical protein